jgi:hypothetical protein
MNAIRGFSSGGGSVPPTRTVDNAAPPGLRQEIVDVVFHVVRQSEGALSEEHLFRVSCQSLGIRAAGQPSAGFRHALGRDIEGVSWQRVYDLICRLWPEFEPSGWHARYREGVNRVLSGYGIVWDLDEYGELRRVLPEEAEQQVATAVRELEESRFGGAKAIFTLALEAYDARPRRDRDACANSFDAMEAVAKVVFAMPVGTCGGILSAARAQNALNPHVLSVLDALNTHRNRNYGHGVPFTLTASEVDFTYLANIAGLLILVKIR